jgi:murein DD-endopeptidase MepM/ murein hydrolase activator NlpD
VRRLVVTAAILALIAEPSARANVFDMVRPLHGDIVRHFEPPPTPYSAGHRGIDLAAPASTTVVAAAGGTVSFAGSVAGDLFVSIDHPNGLRTTYSFLSLVEVKKGQVVTQGQEVARSGGCHTGSAEGCLHFGLKRGDTYLDPEPYLVDHLRRNAWEAIRLTA